MQPIKEPIIIKAWRSTKMPNTYTFTLTAGEVWALQTLLHIHDHGSLEIEVNNLREKFRKPKEDNTND